MPARDVGKQCICRGGQGSSQKRRIETTCGGTTRRRAYHDLHPRKSSMSKRPRRRYSDTVRKRGAGDAPPFSANLKSMNQQTQSLSPEALCFAIISETLGILVSTHPDVRAAFVANDAFQEAESGGRHRHKKRGNTP
jgi:hypothetical protein